MSVGVRVYECVAASVYLLFMSVCLYMYVSMCVFVYVCERRYVYKYIHNTHVLHMFFMRLDVPANACVRVCMCVCTYACQLGYPSDIT